MFGVKCEAPRMTEAEAHHVMAMWNGRRPSEATVANYADLVKGGRQRRRFRRLVGLR